jgi:16S rRNA processing protein RimM
VDAQLPERLVVGLVRGLHGLRGAVRVEMLSDDLTRFRRGSVLHLEGSADPLTITWAQQDGPGILLRFREVEDRPAAEDLRGRYLEAPTVPDLPEGTYWWHEVTGVEVVTTEGEVLGTVEDVFRAGGGEVFVVRGGRRGEVLVPAVHAIVTELAPRSGRIVVDRDALGLDETPPQPRPRGRRTTRALRQAASSATPTSGDSPSANAADPAEPDASAPHGSPEMADEESA